jgi:hypothetical protein
VAFPLHNFVPWERLFVVRRNHFGIRTFPGVAWREPVQRLTHPAGERFFAAPLA